jgi:hypothetical protein
MAAPDVKGAGRPDLRPGAKLKVILTTDHPDRLTKAQNGRTDTAVGANVARIALGPLGLEEFTVARETLVKARMLLFDGAEYAEDYRAPWVLRTIYDKVARDPRYGDPDAGTVLLPPFLGLELVDDAREAFGNHAGLQRGYRLLARDALSDSGARSAELALAASNGFVIRQDALSGESREALAQLMAAGWARTYREAGGEDVVVPTVPAAYLVELADAAGDELGRQAEADPFAAGVWLGERLDAVYLGDLVGAEAIRSLAGKTGGFRSGIIDGLLSIEPQEEVVENALIAQAGPDGQLIHIKIEDGKAYPCDRHGEVRGEGIDLGTEGSRMFSDTTAWMILGHFARLPTAPIGDDSQRMDAWVLLTIGKCPFPLLRTSREQLGHFEHDLPDGSRVLSPIEAATHAMADLLSRRWDCAEGWVEAALATRSLPLVHRVMTALRMVEVRGISQVSAWADGVLRDQVLPAVRALVAAQTGRGADE